MKNIFLSDLHIGVDAATNLYQKDTHQKNLKNVLSYIQKNANQIRDVVIVGDWIDLWMYSATAAPAKAPKDKNTLLPTTTQIMEANPELFKRQDDGSGDFVSCMDSIRGDLWYVNGNHDINVTSDEINAYFALTRQSKKIVRCVDCSKEAKGYVSPSGDIYAEHGHSELLISTL